jgi:hypothetical protein
LQVHTENYIFTTEAHPFRVRAAHAASFRRMFGGLGREGGGGDGAAGGAAGSDAAAAVAAAEVGGAADAADAGDAAEAEAARQRHTNRKRSCARPVWWRAARGDLSYDRAFRDAIRAPAAEGDGARAAHSCGLQPPPPPPPPSPGSNSANANDPRSGGGGGEEEGGGMENVRVVEVQGLGEFEISRCDLKALLQSRLTALIA